MKSARVWAINQLDQRLTSAEKLKLGEEFSVVPWIGNGYQTLVNPTNPFTVHDVHHFGLKTVTRLAEARESIYENLFNRYRSKNRRRPQWTLFTNIEAHLRRLPSIWDFVAEVSELRGRRGSKVARATQRTFIYNFSSIHSA
jgi:hypothetical protein